MKSEVTPSLVLRAYMWQLLKANTNMDELDYQSDENPNGLVPIVPVSEEPELTQFNKPYLVYGYAHNPSRDLYHYRSGSMTLVVYATTFREIGDILSLLQLVFERHDEAAENVNLWSSTIEPFRGIRFGSIHMGLLESGTPEDNDQDTEQTEGGRMSGLINIRYEYFMVPTTGEVKLYQPTTGTWA